MLKTGWISWLSLFFSVIPMVVFFLQLQGKDIAITIMFLPMFLAILLAIIGVVKKTERNVVPAISLLLSIGSGIFILLILAVSGMGQPT